MKPPGTRCRLTYDCGPVAPDVGDIVRTVPGGSCYLVEGVRRSPSRFERVYIQATRLGRDAAQLGDEGVWPLYWWPRRRR